MSAHSSTTRLTRFPVGSIREMLAVAIPLMLTAASGSLMQFIDRVILARYDIAAMNAAVVAVTPLATFQLAAVAIAVIAEVFVGQLNGAGKKEELGWPVWQMIYFSVATVFLFFPLAYWAAPYFIPAAYVDVSSQFLSISFCFAPLFPLVGAISCFFVGQGKVWVVTIAALGANAVNMLLALAFVYGVPGIIPSMGLMGAAWATGFSLLLEALFLLLAFLSPTNRNEFKTFDARLRPQLLFQCLKVGVPSSVGHLVEMLGWSAVIYMVASCSEIHATIYGIALSIWLLFSFIHEGLNKAVIALIANALGARRFQHIGVTYRSAIGIAFIALMATLVFSFMFPDVFLDLFLEKAETRELRDIAIDAFRLIAISLFFDALAWSTAGVITAAGKTRFVMLTCIWVTWFCAVVPIYFFVLKGQAGPLAPCIIGAIYAAVHASVYILYYLSGRWRKGFALIEDVSS